jgi:hypothetical protein
MLRVLIDFSKRHRQEYLKAAKSQFNRKKNIIMRTGDKKCLQPASSLCESLLSDRK